MADLTNLTEFIKESPDLPDRKNWVSSEWEKELTRSIPNWRKVVRDPDNWERIEKIRSKKNYEGLCKVLVEAGGQGIAERWLSSDVTKQRDAAREWLKTGGWKIAEKWLSSDVTEQRDAAREWLIDDASIDASMWQKLDKNIKNALLEDRFRRWPGEPFKTLERYESEIHHMMHRIDRASLSDTILRVGLSNVIPSLPYIVGYVPSPEIENLRFVIKDIILI